MILDRIPLIFVQLKQARMIPGLGTEDVIRRLVIRDLSLIEAVRGLSLIPGAGVVEVDVEGQLPCWIPTQAVQRMTPYTPGAPPPPKADEHVQPSPPSGPPRGGGPKKRPV